jgi:AraC-like DNA-binding protein
MIDSPILQGLSYLNLAIGAAVSVLIVLLILQKQRSTLKFLVATFYLLMLYGLVTGWLARSGLMAAVPFILYTTYVISFAHGPVLYLYTERLLSRTARFKPANLLMFLPAALMLCVVVAYHAGFGDRAAAALARRSPFPEIGDPVMYALCSIADFSVVVYLALAGARVRAAASSAGPGKSGGLRFFFGLYMASALSYLGVLAAHMLDDDGAAMVMSTANGLSALAYFLYVHQSPQITQSTLREPAARRSGDSTAGLSARLASLMDSEKLYRDPELSLASLSERLGTSANRLSQALNDEIGTGFRSYVNALRLEEVKRRLERDDGCSILAIAFDAGFNSKTTFNTLFARETGMTPKEYRQRRGNLPENLL